MTEKIPGAERFQERLQKVADTELRAELLEGVDSLLAEAREAALNEIAVDLQTQVITYLSGRNLELNSAMMADYIRLTELLIEVVREKK